MTLSFDTFHFSLAEILNGFRKRIVTLNSSVKKFPDDVQDYGDDDQKINCFEFGMDFDARHVVISRVDILV